MTFAEGNPAPFFAAPLQIQHMSLSATELSNGTSLTGNALGAFSVFINLTPAQAAKPVISFPVVQGMGFVSAVYDNAQPLILSEIGFLSFESSVAVDTATTFQYKATLNNNHTWIIFITPSGSTGQPPLELKDVNTVSGPAAFSGLVQVAKLPANTTVDNLSTYAASAGGYPINAYLTGSVQNTTGSYTISYQKAGDISKPNLVFALPHQVESFDETTKGSITPLQLITTTKGLATAVTADNLTMIEPDLPLEIGFAPSLGAVAQEAADLIKKTALAELNENMDPQTNLNSMYYSGKVEFPLK